MLMSDEPAIMDLEQNCRAWKAGFAAKERIEGFDPSFFAILEFLCGEKKQAP